MVELVADILVVRGVHGINRQLRRIDPHVLLHHNGILGNLSAVLVVPDRVAQLLRLVAVGHVVEGNDIAASRLRDCDRFGSIPYRLVTRDSNSRLGHLIVNPPAAGFVHTNPGLGAFQVVMHRVGSLTFRLPFGIQPSSLGQHDLVTLTVVPSGAIRSGVPANKGVAGSGKRGMISCGRRPYIPYNRNRSSRLILLATRSIAAGIAVSVVVQRNIGFLLDGAIHMPPSVVTLILDDIPLDVLRIRIVVF